MNDKDLIKLLDDEMQNQTSQVWRALRLAKYRIEESVKEKQESFSAGVKKGMADTMEKEQSVNGGSSCMCSTRFRKAMADLLGKEGKK